MSRSEKLFSRLEKLGRGGEDAVLVLVLTGMILLAAGQIVMRNFFSIGVIWGDELLRMLVLWIAVAGAVSASRGDKHINIAILDRFLPEKVKPAIKFVIHLFTAVVCGIITWHSLLFVQTSKEFGDLLLGGVPAWLLQLILPVGFGLICYRYALFAVKDTVQWFRGGRSE